MSPAREVHRWWEADGSRDGSSAVGESHDPFFDNDGLPAPTPSDLLLDVLSDEQLAEIDVAWFQIDADGSGSL